MASVANQVSSERLTQKTMNARDVRSSTEQIMEEIRQRPDYLNDKDAVMVLARTAVLGNKLLRFLPNEPKQLNSSAVCDFSQFLLEYSYAIELKLINQEFSEDVDNLMDSVFQYLDQALSLLLPQLTSSDELIKVKELLECVYWRKGALCYMYCHTSYKNKEIFLTDTNLLERFLQIAKQGVKHLSVELPSVREDELHANYQSSDESTSELIKQGMFSDTHMLALMYGAELCYWTSQLTNQHYTKDDLDPKRKGLELSGKYLTLANGLLKGSQWKTRTAEKIQSYFTS